MRRHDTSPATVLYSVQININLGSVHYLYLGLVPKRNGLVKPFFWSVKGWVISVLKKG